MCDTLGAKLLSTPGAGGSHDRMVGRIVAGATVGRPRPACEGIDGMLKGLSGSGCSAAGAKAPGSFVL